MTAKPTPSKPTTNPRRRLAVVGARELAQVRASDVLALDPRVLAGGVMLPTEAPATEHRGAVAIVAVDGPLAQRAVETPCGSVDGYDAITARVEAALADPNVRGVVLRICSDGGDVAGLEAAVDAMRAARSRSSKRVVAYVDERALSAVYWLAAGVAADGIFLPKAGLVGSIGVIGALVDESKALEQEGLKVTLVRSPAGKADAHPAGPLPIALERLQARVGEVAGRFVDAVASARRLTPKQVAALDGATLGAEEAVRVGLVDRIGTLEAAIEAAAAPPETVAAMRARLLPAPVAARVPEPWRATAEERALCAQRGIDVAKFERVKREIEAKSPRRSRA